MIFRVAAYLVLFFSLSNAPLALAAGYSVHIPQLPDGLTELLTAVSDCVELQKNPPDSDGLLQRRMENDLKTFADALRSHGYFKATLSADLDQSAPLPTVRFHIQPGPRFTFSSVQVALVPDNPALADLLRDIQNHLRPGTGYMATLVLDTETALLERLKEHGYPLPSMQSRDVVADHAANQVQVRYEIDCGQAAVFGPTEISGLETVSSELVREKLAWMPGAPYDRRLVDQTRADLIRTGLFRSVRLDAEPAGSEVAMRLHLLEAPHRTLRSGLWYYSDQGLGASAGWTHYNVLGGGQELRLDTELSKVLQSARTALILPSLSQPGHSLSLSGQLKKEETDVYTTDHLSLSALFRRPLLGLEVGYGLSFRLADVDKDTTRRFALLSLPLVAEYANVDNVLDPTTGLALSARAEPFTNMEQQSSFILWDISGRHYLPLKADKSVVLASRGRYSLLAGASHDSIPDDLLLYAGGGGSIRGYAWQYAGRLDESDTPLGGVSAVDFSAELRLRLNNDFGWVFFGDGGGAFTDRNPAHQETLFWGAGTGIRYFTPIGPLRLDLAVPLNPRSGVDDPFHVYISLGQAF